jgi:Ala-tRNA(Pro) deacylase
MSSNQKVFEEIVELLNSHQVEFDTVTHEKAITSMDTVRETGFDIKHGAKSILFKTKDGFKLVIVRGDNRADFKKLRQHFATNKIRMATPEEVLEVMRVEVGACYPFGEIAGVDMIVDETLAEAERIHFSPGTHYDHINMRFEDYVKVTKPKLIDVVLN